MSLAINTKTFSPDKFGADAVGYVGPNHTLSLLDDLQLSRVSPKPTDVFSGVGRVSTKLTRTLSLTGAKTLTGNAIVQINVSVPVGAADADIDALLNDTGSFLSGADAKTQVKKLQISF